MVLVYKHSSIVGRYTNFFSVACLLSLKANLPYSCSFHVRHWVRANHSSTGLTEEGDMRCLDAGMAVDLHPGH